ncbi:hypothetical protein D9M72_350410 [compost metagenome]
MLLSGTVRSCCVPEPKKRTCSTSLLFTAPAWAGHARFCAGLPRSCVGAPQLSRPLMVGDRLVVVSMTPPGLGAGGPLAPGEAAALLPA